MVTVRLPSALPAGRLHDQTPLPSSVTVPSEADQLRLASQRAVGAGVGQYLVFVAADTVLVRLQTGGHPGHGQGLGRGHE